ncbi:MAG: helix-turn-helix domain-containing protein [Deltaproteobacteria bacterium]|nr:helix-turn-helix domain-containing protein [Deltaproteobacteria bacterium]
MRPDQEHRGQRSGLIALPPLKRYFRIDEVAVYFAISARTIYRLLDEGDLQVTRIRGCVRVSSEELKRFEESLRLDDDMP